MPHFASGLVAFRLPQWRLGAISLLVFSCTYRVPTVRPLIARSKRKRPNFKRRLALIPLIGRSFPKKIASRVLIQKAADPNNEADRQQQFEWLTYNVERFQTAFADRIKALNLDQGDEVDP
jgi:hypothetical protein